MNDDAQRAAEDHIDDVSADEVHQPFVDADDTRVEDTQVGGDGAHDQLEQVAADLNRIGDNLAKAASEAAYATVGLVGLVGDRVRKLYEEQKAQYTADHPDFEGEPDARHLLSRFGEQLDRFVGDVGSTIHDLAERGRATSKPEPTPEPGAATAESEATEAPTDEE